MYVTSGLTHSGITLFCVYILQIGHRICKVNIVNIASLIGMYEVTTLRNILKDVRAQLHWRSGIVLNQLSTLLKTRKNLAKVAAYHRAIVAMQWIYHRQSLCKSSVPIDTYVLFSQKECS